MIFSFRTSLFGGRLPYDIRCAYNVGTADDVDVYISRIIFVGNLIILKLRAMRKFARRSDPDPLPVI